MDQLMRYFSFHLKVLAKFFFVSYLIVLLTIILPSSSTANNYRIVTSELPPWSIDDRSGIFTEIVLEIERRIGSNHKPVYLPWSRAQLYAKSLQPHIIFPLTRTANRQDQYTWIVKVVDTKLAFATLSSPIGLEEARTLGLIAVQQDTPPQKFLTNQGFKNLQSLTSGVGPIPKMLEKGRIDAWFSAEAILRYNVLGTSLEKRIVIGPTAFKAPIYIAALLGTPSEIVEKYQAAFETIYNDGTYEQIIIKYIGSTPKITGGQAGE